MSAENNKNNAWRMEDQPWWKKYSAVVQNADQKVGCGSAFAGSGSNFGSGLFIHGSSTSAYGSGLYFAGSNTSAYGSGLYFRGSNTSAYGSGLYIHGSNSRVYGSGLSIYGSNTSAYGKGSSIPEDSTSAYGSGLLIPENSTSACERGSSIQESDANAYGAPFTSAPPVTREIPMEDVFVPEYLKKKMTSSDAEHTKGGVLAYGLDLI